MKKIAMIQNGLVMNIAVWDGKSEWNPKGFSLVDVTDNPNVAIGYSYDGKNFTAPIGE